MQRAVNSKYNVKAAIYKLVSDGGSIGWYEMEHRLNIPRGEFKRGYTLMTYLDEMVAEKTLELSLDEKYISLPTKKVY